MATLDQLRLQQLLQPFDNRTGIVNTNQALPMINNNPFINTGAIDQNLRNTDLIQQIIAQNQMKVNTADTAPFFFPTSSIRQQVPLQNLGIDTSYGVANEEDVEQEFLPGQERSGIAKLLDYVPFIGEKSLAGTLLRTFLPKQDPRATGIRNFYSPEGLTSTGSIASGIMKGYNPVSGGFLNKITGGRFGQPTQYGLSGAMQRRIENILGRKIAQTNASRAKVAELRNLQRAEMRDRADRGESLSSIGKSTFSGPGMAFERRSGGSSGKKGTSSERNYGGR